MPALNVIDIGGVRIRVAPATPVRNARRQLREDPEFSSSRSETTPHVHSCPGCGKVVRWALAFCAPCSAERGTNRTFSSDFRIPAYLDERRRLSAGDMKDRKSAKRQLADLFPTAGTRQVRRREVRHF